MKECVHLQTSMAFAGDNEDVVSMALTVVSELLRKYDVAHGDIGRYLMPWERVYGFCHDTHCMITFLLFQCTDLSA